MSSGISSCSSHDAERSAHESSAGKKLRKRSRGTRNKMDPMARAITEEDDEDYFSDSGQVTPAKRARSHASCTRRERARMHKLNNAYGELRKVVPKLNSDSSTLRLAIDYITMLTNFLDGSPQKEASPPNRNENSDGDTTNSIEDDSDILAKLIDSVVEEFSWLFDEHF